MLLMMVEMEGNDGSLLYTVGLLESEPIVDDHQASIPLLGYMGSVLASMKTVWRAQCDDETV